jgi:hypothetical protein
MNITLKINGIDHSIDTVWRGLGFHGVKFGEEEIRIAERK